MLVRGRDQGLPAWHYILVPLDNLESLKRQPRGGNIDVEDFGHILQYQDENGNVQSASGWGKNPPRHLQRWLGDQLSKYLVFEVVVTRRSILLYIYVCRRPGYWQRHNIILFRRWYPVMHHFTFAIHSTSRHLSRILEAEKISLHDFDHWISFFTSVSSRYKELWSNNHF